MSTQDASIRRVRSDGDIVRPPQRAYTASHLRFDSTGGPQSGLSSAPPVWTPVAAPPPITQSPVDLAHPHPLPPSPPRHPLSLYVRILTYFGLGRHASHQRKSKVSFVWSLTWGFIQVTVLLVMLVLTGTYFKSTTDPDISEWTACDRPLGVWASLWIVRVLLASVLAYWEFQRDRILHPPRRDTESEPNSLPGHEDAFGAHTPTQPYHTPAQDGHGENNPPAVDPATLPYTSLYSRLTLLSSVMTLSWFLTAHILEYTSLNTCRHTSPHLWWLIFGILCIMYVMVLEVVLLGFVVLVIAPILFIFWNIFLICIGRHPMQNPEMMKPGKLSKSVVERIPLVVYIPPPPAVADADPKENAPPVAPHVYPPIPEGKPRKARFKFLKFGRKKSTGKKEDKEKAVADQEPVNEEMESWRQNWEESEYPFVTLEGNRASCAICLMDYDPPKKKNADNSENAVEATTTTPAEEPQATDDTRAEASTSGANVDETAGEPTLLDAGEGAQPLRLLACSHVFHKTCIDPWLINVSGRCPVCQRPVEVAKKK